MEHYKIYVAGKNIDRASKVMATLREHGYEIAYDWATHYDDDRSVAKVIAETEAVRGADALVYLWEADQQSARYEAGMAMGLGKKIIVSCGPNSFFFKLPNIHSIDSDDEILKTLKSIL